MKYYLLLALLLPFSALGIEFEGASQKPVEVKAEASSGLNGIYVVADTYGMSMVYTAGSSTGAIRSSPMNSWGLPSKGKT